MTARTKARLLAALLSLQGCTLDAGHGFATIEESALHMELAPGRSRDLGDSGFLTDEGYRVDPTSMTLHVSELGLLELRGAQAGAVTSFDPANPPEGFTLCHGGHCHADDGSLVDYADVQAVLAGGAARFEPLATLPVDRTFDLLEGETAALTRIVPSAELPRSSIDRIEIEVTRLRLSAEIEGGDLPQPVTLEIDTPVEQAIAGTLSVIIDRNGPERLELVVALRFDATLFDGVDLSSLVEEGSVVIDDEGPVDEAVREWLASADVTIGL
jgi:hypothetical protein